MAKNWQKAWTTWIGVTLIVLSAIYEVLYGLKPLMQNHGDTVLLVVGALVAGLRVIKQKAVSGDN